MTTYGITKRQRAQFAARFATYYFFNPTGENWTSLAEALNHVNNRQEFRNSYGYPEMVEMLRTNCQSAGLTREDRGEPPHVQEGYLGLTGR